MGSKASLACSTPPLPSLRRRRPWRLCHISHRSNPFQPVHLIPPPVYRSLVTTRPRLFDAPQRHRSQSRDARLRLPFSMGYATDSEGHPPRPAVCESGTDAGKASRETERSQMAGRKRNASQMEDDSSASASATADGSENRGTREKSKVGHTIETDPGDFVVTCPVMPQRKKILERDKKVSILHDCPLEQSQLAIDFAVEPGLKWDGLSRFKNAKCEFQPVLQAYPKLMHFRRLQSARLTKSPSLSASSCTSIATCLRHLRFPKMHQRRRN